MTTTVHLAGNRVCIEGRVIQRCLVCGYKLVDSKGMVTPDDDDRGVPTWEIGHLISVSGGDGVTGYSDIGDTHQPFFEATWQDCCINLIEE